MPNYFQIDPAVFDKKIFLVFLMVDFVTRIMYGIEISE